MVNEIEQLRQRVQELEKERDSAYKIADHYRAERDKATQYWQIAEGRCDALMKQRDELLDALEGILNSDRTRIGIDEYHTAKAAIASVKEKQDAAD